MSFGGAEVREQRKATGKEELPAFKTFDEALAYAHQKQDNFFVTAFILEAWIGFVIAKTVEQYAENKSGTRRLQTGVAQEAWRLFLGQAEPLEWVHILECMGRFGNCDTQEAEILSGVFVLVDLEDKHAEPVTLNALLARMPKETVSAAEAIERMRFLFRRMGEWLEAIVHWRAHWMTAVAPISAQPTEERRELVSIGIMQAAFAALNKHGKDWWRFRHEELAEKFLGKPEWRLVGQAQSFDRLGALKNPGIDELTIYWWPLLTRYGWTDRDMRGLIARAFTESDDGAIRNRAGQYPLRDDKEFADYRQKALGLVKGKPQRDRSAPDGSPKGWKTAFAMIGKLSE